MFYILLFLAILLGLGIWEKRRHQKNLDAIPIRVNVNGVRGKSTVTRLITGILTEAGLKTVGKTTGTSARMIYWFTDEEKPIIRRLEGPNIREQKMVVAEAAELGAEALVSECMAVHPDYQITFQQDMLQANVGVIVNVLEDHMDVLGPTLDEVAQAFTATIPYDGHLVITDGPYRSYFEQVAMERNTQVIVADPSRITEDYLRQFTYVCFPDNAAIALAVAQALGIDEETAKRGMLKAHPDPGALRVLPLGDHSFFVNGFAANDAASTLNIWQRIQELGYPTADPMVIMNCRPDRVDRTEQFAADVLPHIETDILVLVGQSTGPIRRAYEEGKIPARQMLDLDGCTTEEVIEQIGDKLAGRVIYGVGNIHGTGEPLIEWFEALHQQARQAQITQDEAQSEAAVTVDSHQQEQNGHTGQAFEQTAEEKESASQEKDKVIIMS
ncbi:poly-gamma-glutamate synthase PgsB/CapB [Caldalkalibacillus uzonensis]|uniref:Poly-gamma-glutamate synthase PgsB/CapB n=1 Tax=Caldalkalibacillus uzonensis TaxID=353224 RepID=A0ABU0CQ67_9BACI|nr:poly-gamma-glutamate synthase PgsB/CapB [Caldalkalibacillus uzonensis]